VKIACGRAHNAVLVNSENLNQLYTWGCGLEGRLGNGDKVDRNIPCKVESFQEDISDVECGFLHTAAISKGKLYTFGSNEFGQLGTGDKKFRDAPFLLNLDNVKTVICGGFHTLCYCEDQSVYSWGSNSNGI
jgi:alpha-tubulin suppressor-like RCC1 family protein